MPRPEGADPPPWHAIERLAYVHGVEPVLHDLCSRDEALSERIPAALREAWESAYVWNSVHNSELLESLRDVRAGCSEHGIDTLVLKGLANAARLYDDPGLRTMVDIDLLCRPGDLGQLAAIAGSLGYRSVGENSTYHQTFVHPELQRGLELHFDLYEVVARRAALLEEVWRTQSRIEMDGVELRAPAPEAAVVVDLAHLIHHNLELGLKSYLDFAIETLVDWRSLDPETLRTLLRRADLEDEFGQIVTSIAALFGLPVPKVWRADLSRSAPQPDLTEALRQFLAEIEEYREQPLLAGADGRSGLNRTDYLRRVLVPPLPRLKALAGSDSSLAALLHLPVHLVQAVGRGLAKVRRGPAPSFALRELSLRSRVYRRRGGG